MRWLRPCLIVAIAGLGSVVTYADGPSGDDTQKHWMQGQQFESRGPHYCYKAALEYAKADKATEGGCASCLAAVQVCAAAKAWDVMEPFSLPLIKKEPATPQQRSMAEGYEGTVQFEPYLRPKKVDPKAAEMWFRKAAEDDPENAQAWLGLGKLLATRKSVNEARDAFAHYHGLLPKEHPDYIRSGWFVEHPLPGASLWAPHGTFPVAGWHRTSGRHRWRCDVAGVLGDRLPPMCCRDSVD